MKAAPLGPERFQKPQVCLVQTACQHQSCLFVPGEQAAAACLHTVALASAFQLTKAAGPLLTLKASQDLHPWCAGMPVTSHEDTGCGLMAELSHALVCPFWELHT